MQLSKCPWLSDPNNPWQIQQIIIFPDVDADFRIIWINAIIWIVFFNLSYRWHLRFQILRDLKQKHNTLECFGFAKVFDSLLVIKDTHQLLIENLSDKESTGIKPINLTHSLSKRFHSISIFQFCNNKAVILIGFHVQIVFHIVTFDGLELCYWNR